MTSPEKQKLTSPKIMVVTGEASSDQHAAGVVKALKLMVPEIEVFGMGGSHLRQAGMEIVVDIATYGSIMGFAEVVSSLGKIYTAFRSLEKAAETRRPDLAILVDYPDFNLRLAKSLHRRGIKVFYFICPQIWAWRQSRAKIIKKYVTKVAPIFPFEEQFYLQRGIDAKFVGYPFMDRIQKVGDRTSFCQEQGVDPTAKILAILPGSRRAEVERLHRPMLECFQLLRKDIPTLQALLPVAPTVKEQWLRLPPSLSDGVKYLKGQAGEVLRYADVGIIASGTASMEACLAELPMVVAYKLNPLSYQIGRRVVKGVINFAMPNIIAGREIVRELLQGEATAANMANHLRDILTDDNKRQKIIEDLREVKAKLSYSSEEGSTAAERVARMALELI